MKTSNNSSAQHWHILGAGSIGCLWAAHLSLAGNKVTLLLKNRARLEEFQQSPEIRLSQYNEPQASNTSSIAVQAEIYDQQNTLIKNLLVCTKSIDAAIAVRSIAHRINSDTRLILLLNGMGIQQEIAQDYPSIPLICGTTTDGAYRLDTFHVVQAGTGTTYFGLLNPGSHNKHQFTQQQLMGSFQDLRLNTQWDEQILTRLWYKLAVNCIINPITAIQACRNGAILDQGGGLETINGLCQELELVMNKLEIPQQPQSLYEQVLRIARATAGNYSSMYQDIKAGRQTEIDYINGYLCWQAAQLEIPVPMNQELYQRVKQMQQQTHRQR